MRFIIKTAFWLGLIAFFLPSGTPEDAASPQVDYFSAFLGFQQAVGDLGGFCERSPMACEAGGDVAAFVGARVGDGLTYAFNAARATMNEGEPVAVAAVAPALAFEPTSSPSELAVQPAAAGPSPYRRPQLLGTDPMLTAAVAAETVRKAAGLPPYGAPTTGETGAQTAPSLVPVAAMPTATRLPVLPVPTPAPRA